MRSLRALLCVVGCWALIGCHGEEQLVPPPGGVIPSDPSDPVICFGDPDTTFTCKKASEFWDCTSMPNGEIKCAYKEPFKPDGTNTWVCKNEGGTVTCTTTTAGVKGSGGWTCVPDGTGTKCTITGPLPPSGPTGGSGYGCVYSESEFSWTCTGKATPPTPGSDGGVVPPPPGKDGGVPITPPPPSGGDTICYDVVPGTTGVKPPEGVWAKLTAKKVSFNGVPAIYVKLTLSKGYVDNTYGAWAIGYESPTSIGKHHSFQDLLESDKNEFFLSDAKGDLIMDFDMDYFSQGGNTKSGYDCLGVTGGEGAMLKGNASDYLAGQTSLDVNFNTYGYVLTKDSPKTDLNYTPDPAYPKWIFEVEYEFWVKLSAFGTPGPGRIYITGLHASPNKLNIKPLPMTPGACP